MPISVKSPMINYIDKYDVAHIDQGYNQYWVNAINQDYRVWNTLWYNEIKFREANIKNLIFSISGIQGDGKSAGLLRGLKIVSDVYNSRFTLKNFHFFQEHLKEGLDKAKKRTQHGLDEQPRIHGLMSGFIADELANYEDIYRKPQISVGYASPTLRAHEHFFMFQALGDIELDEKTGRPISVQLMLKTRRKSDGLIMPRGVIKLAWPDWETWLKYDERKDKFIKRMQGQKSYLMEKIISDAEKVIEAKGDKLYRYLKDGEKLPGTKTQIDLAIYEVLGMRAYTVEGYKILREAIKQKL